FTMTVHDRMLREEIEELPDSSPTEIRRATLKVESTGLAGPATTQAAKQATSDEDSERLLTNFFLVSEAIRQLSAGQLQLAPADPPAGPAGRGPKRSRSRWGALLARAADESPARLETWAGAVSPVGAPGLNYICRQRQLIADLNDYAADVEAWSERDMTDA